MPGPLAPPQHLQLLTELSPQVPTYHAGAAPSGTISHGRARRVIHAVSISI
jgi:hypothetical protein